MPGVSVSVKADVEAVREMIGKARNGVVNRATASALNKAAKNVQVEASKQIRQYRHLPAATVKKALTIIKAIPGRLSATIIASGRPIPLKQYGAHTTKSGVTVTVMPESGSKVVTAFGNKAFQAPVYGDNVFVRTSQKRLPIKKLYGPSIPTAMVKDSVESALRVSAGDNWPKRFKEELKYRLEQIGFNVQ